MTINRDDAIWEISCDECTNTLEADRTQEFGDLVVTMKAQGWRIERLTPCRGGTGWKHLCPDHA